MAKVLSLKYRPQTFDEIWAQDHIKNTLKKAIENNRIANAYLFCGPRGVGKTTTARVLAKSLNCLQGISFLPCGKCPPCVDIANSRSIDVLEIDGASNRGIDEVRNIRENVKYAPVFSRYKIYIIDEVHMLTDPAFNALLKTLEEPPPHVKFILATTAPHKVPETIISRCQRFDFRKGLIEEIVDRLRFISKKENIKIEEAALYAIARKSDGAIRDGEVILDQLAAYGDKVITPKMVEDILGIIPEDIFFTYSHLLYQKDIKALLQFIGQLNESGYDPIEFFSGAIKFFRTLLLLKYELPSPTLGLSAEDYKKFLQIACFFTTEKVLSILNTLLANEGQMKRTSSPEILLEIISLKITQDIYSPSS